LKHTTAAKATSPIKRITTAQAIGAFMASRETKGCSEATLSWYGYMLRPLARQHQELPAEPFAIEQLVGNLPIKQTSKMSHWRALTVFYGWAQRRLGAENPMPETDRPIVRKQLPKALSRDQVQRLLHANRGRPRTYAMLLLALDTGARAGEIASLTKKEVIVTSLPDDVDIRINGKTGERFLPIQPETYRALRRLMLPDVDAVWTNARRGHADRRATTRALKDDAEAAFKRAGFDGGLHKLRHTFGLMYIQGGGDVFTLQELMGHASITTTRVYLTMSRRDVKQAHAKYSPIRQLFTVIDGGKQERIS
jgi:integrase/recombinase XerD